MASPSEPDGRARRGFISRGHRGLFRNDFRLLHKRDSTPSPLKNEISSRLATEPEHKQRLERRVRNDGGLIFFAGRLAGA